MARRCENAEARSNWIQPDSHTNYRFLATPEKVERLRLLHHEHRLMRKKLTRLQGKLQEAIARQVVCADETTNSDLQAIMKEEEDQVMKLFPDGSFQQIFWEQQKKAAAKKDPRGVRWHPLMIRFCLYLRHQSGKAYDTLRESGCIQLSLQRTLRDYSHAVKATPGFSQEVDSQLLVAANVMTSKEWEKLVVILLDEMYIR